ncbi:MAG: hypothetical protein GF387_02855 [Candidatus Portnoybacteria bacterium]|nr:hypothetical protein [Candidatus Portnoybacteria bacterium]
MIKKILITLLIAIFPITALAQVDFNLDNIFDTYNFVPSRVELQGYQMIWSTDTYTPYEYKGRALPSIGSDVIVEAIVNTSNGSPSDLKYSWFIDDIFQRSRSGYGKTKLKFTATRPGGSYHSIRLQIFNEDRTIFQEKTIKIPIASPELKITSSPENNYFSRQDKSPLVIFADKQNALTAQPYFFSIKSLSDLSFEWMFEEKKVNSSEYRANVLNLNITNKDTEEIIERTLNVRVFNKNNPNQEVYKNINLLID